jgi:4-hydroxy-3-methylbut-2-enyl diphosphate reductase
MEILLAQPRGFCAGVSRAIDVVEKVLALEGAPIYVRHEVVHNQYVVKKLRRKGAVFVDELHEIPDGSTVIFSAHGVSDQVQKEASKRQMKVYDATCPLVTKVHIQVQKASQQSQECILIGHKDHPEVEGTLGQYNNSSGGIYLVENIADVDTLNVKDPNNLMYVTQTTLSMEETEGIINALKQKYPKIDAPKKEDICYATQNRQNAVKDLAYQSDIVLVVGSASSSNSNRLKELAEKIGVDAFLIDGPEDIQVDWFQGKSVIGLTAGASAPEELVEKVVDYLKTNLGCRLADSMEQESENVTFPLPKLLKSELLSKQQAS